MSVWYLVLFRMTILLLVSVKLCYLMFQTQVRRVLLWWWSLWSWMWFLSLLAQCLVYGVWYATLRERSGSIHHSWASISALCLCGAESSLNHWPFAPGLDRCPRSKSLAVYFGHLPPTVVNQHDLCRYYRRCWTMCVCVFFSWSRSLHMQGYSPEPHTAVCGAQR